jgi:hypothetical protein
MPSTYRDFGKGRYGFVALLLAEIRGVTLLKSVQTGAGAYKASHFMENGAYFLWGL